MTKHLKTLIERQPLYDSYTSRNEIVNWWCGGCGNYPIQNALKRALTLEGITKREVVFCYDVGCVGNGSDKIEGYTIHGLHGRVLPLAAGVKIANRTLHVIAEAGDGGTFSEGINHLAHAARNDYPIVFLHHDNQNYALTTGQASALTPQGCKLNASPNGTPVEPLNPLEVMLGFTPSFIAQTCSADIDHMTEMIRKGLNHKGFAFINIFQACPTYNKFITHDWFLDHIRPIEVDFPEYDPTDIDQARRIAATKDPLYMGLVYYNPKKKNFFQTVEHCEEACPILTENIEHVDISSVLEKF